MKTVDVAKKLDISQNTVRRLAQEGLIGRVIKGVKRDLYIFDEDAINRFMTLDTGVEVEVEYEINLDGIDGQKSHGQEPAPG